MLRAPDIGKLCRSITGGQDIGDILLLSHVAYYSMPALPRGYLLDRNFPGCCALADVPPDKPARKLNALDGGVGVLARGI